MPNNIYHKRNANPGVVPTAAQLTVGEIALNTADGKAYTRTTAGTVVELTEASVADGGEQFTPLNVPNLALWLDSSDVNSLYTTDAGPVTAVSSPLDIAGCIAWWDFSDAASLSVTSGSINSCNDKSGNNFHLNASGTNRPTLTTAIRNGLNAAEFDGADDLMTATFTGTYTASTVIAVVYPDTAGGGNLGRILSRGTSSLAYDGANTAFRFNPPYTGATGNGGQRTANSSATQDQWHLLAFTWNGGFNVATDIVPYLSGAVSSASLTGTGDALSATDVNNFTLGNRAIVDGADRGWDGYIGEIIVFNTAISAAARARVERYLAIKWGISQVHTQAAATNDPVGAWLDKSGNNRHATQPTAANRPTRAVAANNRNTLLFTGSSTAANAQRLSISNMPVNNNELFSVFTVIRETTQTAGIAGRVAIGYRGPTFQYALLSQTFGGSSSIYWYHAGATPQFPPASNVANIYVVQKTSTTTSAPIGITLLFNGANVTPRPLSAAGGGGNFGLANFVTSLGSSDGGTNSFTGHICELIAIPRVVSTAERTSIERYLADRWGISLAPPPVSNADAQDWVNRVYAVGGTVSQSTANAVNTFCNAIDAAGIRDRFYRLNLFCGDNLNACLVPLYRGPSLGGTQLGNGSDTNNNFLSTDYNERGAVGGLKGNGSSKYLSTGLPMTFLGSNLVHMFASFVGAAEGFTILMGARSNLTGSLTLEAVYAPTIGSNRARAAIFSPGYQASNNASPSTGRTQLLAQCSDGTNQQHFVRNVDLGAVTGPAGAYSATNTTPFYIFAGDIGTSSSSILANSPHWIDSYSIGAAFTTAAGRTAFHDALTAFQNTLQRVQ